eukprot:513985_1
MQRLVLSIILGQFMTIVFGKIVELTCPATSALPIPIKNSLYSSCFDLDITVNVENILPDSTYILPQDNINAISDGIKRTFDYCDIEIEPDETEIDNIWTIDNQCTHLSSQLQTLNRRQFITSQYNTSCDQDTLIIDEITGTIKCQLTFPESIVYVWHLQQINLKIDIESCSDVIMHAKISIYNNTETKYGHYMAVSQPAKISEDDPSDKKYEFKFNTSTNMLLPNITYFVTFDIINASGWHNQKHDKFEFEHVECDEIITMSEPSSCSLGKTVAVTKEIAFGLVSLCNQSMSQPEQELFESVLFQNHSSHNHLSGNIWDSLADKRNRNLLDLDGGGPNDAANSLIITFSDGTTQTIADDSIFPSINQCVAVDENTQRVFSVGGNDKNGNGMDRLAVYYIAGQTNLILLDYLQLKLDKPRAMTSCYYYKRNDNEEYIVVINGMNHTKYANYSDYWYKDIAFIPLNTNTNTNDEKDCNIKTVELKFNVIDMKSFITENHILYLIGGRNHENATNIIQIIDLHKVFNVSDSKNGKKNSKEDISGLITYERMAPMSLNRVFPFVDFSYISYFNETCMVIWSGQNYINKQWIGIHSSDIELQMYCNQLLIGYLNTTRETLDGSIVNVQFTDYDEKHLVSIEDITNDTMLSNDRVCIRHYNFTNHGLLYKFSVKFKICLDDNEIDFFNDFNIYNQQILEENILSESQKNYRDWSYGFGKVDITGIDIAAIPCSKDSKGAKDSKNKKGKEGNKYKAVSVNMGDKIDKYNYQTDEHYDNNMWKNIVAFGLCIIFLLWLSITCCCNKYKLCNKLTTKSVF